MNSAPRKSRSVGFTLIEVLVALGVLAVIVLGTSALATVVQDEFFKYTLRQKAVYTLHGTMQRLVAEYQSNNDGWVAAGATADFYATNLPGHAELGVGQIPQARLIPSTTGENLGNGAALVPAVIPERGFSTTDPDEFGLFPWLFLVMDLGAPGQTVEDRALVWLDRERRLVASVSFTLDNPDLTGAGGTANPNPPDMPSSTLDPQGCGPAAPGPELNRCGMLVVYVEFPFVMLDDNGDGTEDNITPLFAGYTETYTVATIVGAHLP